MKARKLIAMLLVVATLMSFAPMAVFAADGTYVVQIKYVAVGGPLDGQEVAAAWSGSFAEGSAYTSDTITLPTIEGYVAQAPEDVAGVEVTMTDDGGLTFKFENLVGTKEIVVTYVPAAVGMTVEYYQQNVDNDDYTKIESATKFIAEAKTGDPISDYVDYDSKEGVIEVTGSYALWFDSSKTVAADGNTVVKVYYDREYYLLSFDLGGGYGVDPQFLRYGQTVETVGTPTRPGYTFAGWYTDAELTTAATVPTTMPADNVKLYAKWTAVASANYTVVFWGENANDEGYSYIKSVQTSGTPGATAAYSSVSSGLDSDLWTFKSADDVTINADGSTVVNVYYDRNTFTITFKATSGSGWNQSTVTVYTITEKWGADLSEHWPIVGTNGTTYDSGERWDPSGSDIYSEVLVYIAVMPAESFTLTVDTGSNRPTYVMNYHVEVLPGATYESQYTYSGTTKNFKQEMTISAKYNFVTYEEDFLQLEGFTRWISDPEFSSSTESNPVNFYYSRNSYTLDFHNGEEVVESESVLYEAPLSTYDSFVPEKPSYLEASGYEFGGWYLNPECTGEEFVLNNETMPAENLLLYAKWVPVTHDVTVYLTAEAAEAGTNPISTETVNHRAFATAPEGVTNEPYTFVAWFYVDENGVEKAFDFASMQITKDMVVYAKWKATTPVNYTVKFQLTDGTAVADSINGKALPFTGVTAEAKVGDELYAAYQNGFFPDSPSKSLEVTGNAASNVIVFTYTEATKVPYTVKYLLAGTEQPMSEVTGNNAYANQTRSDNTKVVVTENALIIPGYLADAPQKRLIVTADGKAELIFYYTENDTQAYIQETHYKVKDGVTSIYQELPAVLGTIGNEYSRSALTITNYAFDHATVTYYDADGVLHEDEAYTPGTDYTLYAGGLHFEFYYIPNEFYVYHQSNGETVTYALPQYANFDVTTTVYENYLYGGLYTDDTFTTAYTYENLADAYNGDPTDGMHLTPAAGETYYLKEVDNRFIRPGMYHVWDNRTINGVTDELLAVYLVTGIDDTNYMEVGFTVNGTVNGTDVSTKNVVVDNSETATTNESAVHDYFSVKFLKQNFTSMTDYDESRSKDYTVNDFFKGTGSELNGHLYVHSFGVDTKEFTYGAYFVTPDGIRVDGIKTRTVAHDGTTTDMVNTLTERASVCTDVVTTAEAEAVAFAPLTLRSSYTVLGQAATPVYTITKVNGTTTETVLVKGGDQTGTIGYTEKTGYIFAGWYTDKACTKPADFSDIQSDMTVYPKYVSAKQVTTKTTALGKFMTATVSVPGTDLTQVGVSYTLDGETTNVLCKKSQGLISGLKKLLGSKTTTYTASWNMKGLTNGDTFTVTTYWVTADGTMVEIETNDFAYSRNRISVQ